MQDRIMPPQGHPGHRDELASLPQIAGCFNRSRRPQRFEVLRAA
jgi:hypothetical protein